MKPPLQFKMAELKILNTISILISPLAKKWFVNNKFDFWSLVDQKTHQDF